MEQIISLIITIIAIFICAKLVLKKYNPILIFFVAGIIISFYLAIARGYTPIEEASSGNIYLDIFGFIGYEFKDQLSSVGTNLMVVAGYAAMMTHIGASAKLADTATKPLLKLNMPYVILAFLYVVGIILKMMITSHAGLALLLMATTFPILRRLGISKLSAASAILLSGSMDWGVNDGAVMFAADNVSDMSVGDYFVKHQLVIAIITIITVAIVMSIYFKRLDSKIEEETEKEVTLEVKEDEQVKSQKLPGFYAFLPALPLLLVIGSLAFPTIELDVFTANVIGVAVTFICEFFRTGNDRAKAIGDSLNVMFKAMGNSFANIVTLIVAASVFAKGLIELGGITLLANQIAKIQGAQLITIIALSLLSFLAVIILGSGNAGWYAFGPLVTDMAAQVGLQPFQIAVPMQLAAGMGRALSPVAAAMISVAGLAGVSVEDLIKRNTVPILCGWAANVISSYILIVLL